MVRTRLTSNMACSSLGQDGEAKDGLRIRYSIWLVEEVPTYRISMLSKCLSSLGIQLSASPISW